MMIMSGKVTLGGPRQPRPDDHEQRRDWHHHPTATTSRTGQRPLISNAVLASLAAMTTAVPSTRFLHLLVGYDGSPPASRALDGAARLLQGRIGRIDVVYVAHLSSLAALSPGAIAEVENDFDKIEQELRGQAAAQLHATGAAWQFERRQGLIADQQNAAATAIGEAHPDENVAIIVGSSSHATHRIIGSVAVGLARHSPVPLMIVP
jgi:nucleotide-binding universal stress UspA family protein